MNLSSVADFYRDRCVFITGATGFIGKVLIEKFLRCCVGVRHIYVLVRPKGGQDVHSRVKNLLNCSIFSHLHTTNPEVFEKVTGVSGDILLPGLGLSEEDFETLTEDVSVVFHAAASIRFNDTLKFATNMNIVGTMKVVELCKQMHNLVAFVHVSTAFSNCDKKNVDEVVYPPPMDPYRVLSLSEWLNEDVLEAISAKLIESKITTYHFTKSITENILEKEADTLPIIMVRPSVVVGAWKEPLPGWTETLYHINGILVASGRGVLRVLHCNPKSVVDIVPVDMVSNLLLVSAWFKAIQKSKSGISIYNYVSGVDKPLTYGHLRDYSLPVLRDSPLLYPVWYPSLHLIENRYIAKVISFLLHRVPAYVLDGVLRIAGKEPRLERVVKRIEKSQQLNQNFLHNEFHFTDSNVKTLWNELNKTDKDIFYFNLADIPWKQYLRSYILGCKQYVAKEDLSTLPLARKQMNRMCWLHNFVYWFIIMPFICWILVSIAA